MAEVNIDSPETNRPAWYTYGALTLGVLNQLLPELEMLVMAFGNPQRLRTQHQLVIDALKELSLHHEAVALALRANLSRG